MSEFIHFNISGDFLTRRVREMLWQDKQSYSDVSAVLCECMANANFPTLMRDNIIKKILSGKAKFSGTNTMSIVEDNDPNCKSLEINDLLEQIRTLEKENRDVKSQLDTAVGSIAELTKIVQDYKEFSDEIVADLQARMDPIIKLRKFLSHSSAVDATSWNGIFYDTSEKTKKAFNDFCAEFNIYPKRSYHGLWEWTSFCDKDTNEQLDVHQLRERGISIPDKSVKETTPEPKAEPETPTQPYGWLSPSGDFIESPFGTHEESALKILSELHILDEYHESETYLARDFLIKRGYILLHNPTNLGRTICTTGTKVPTKAQQEFLFDYYSKSDDSTYASALFQSWE